MSGVKVRHKWADGSVTVVTVQADDAYPDSLDEARAVAVRMLSEAVAAMSGEDE